VHTIHVIATTDEGTRRALMEAQRLSEAFVGRRIVVLVPHQVSYATPSIDPAEAPAIITERYRTLVSKVGIEASVRLCFCRHEDDAFRWLLVKESIVVIGGRRRKWWPSHAERVARRLTKVGHQVIFATVTPELRPAGPTGLLNVARRV